MHRARFFFDAGSGTVLWSDAPQTWARFDYPIDLDELPVSDALRDELTRLVAAYDTSLDWDYPPDPGPWSETQCVRFNEDVRSALARLRAELAPDWDIVDEYADLHQEY